MKCRLDVICMAVFIALLPGVLMAQPTLDDVKQAAANGVAWLVTQQNPTTGQFGDWEPVAVTGLSVKKLMHHAVDPKYGLGLPSPFVDDYAYKAQVEKGLEFLFLNASVVDIGLQPAGDPDTNGNGKGVCFACGGWHQTYTTGIVLMALCEAVELDRVVPAGGPLAGKTYEEVARDAMDFLAFGQTDDPSPARGGWYYGANYGWSDNSNSGYATLGLGYAELPKPEGCGFELPQFVKNELNLWIDYIQNDVNGDPDDGGSGYSDPNGWVNTLKTGNLLQQMALVGDTPDTQRVKDALDYLSLRWTDQSLDPGWIGWGGPSDYQATFTLMKGLYSMGIEKFGSPEIDWQTDFEIALLAQQNADGSWPCTNWDQCLPQPILSTTWALLTLQKAAPVPKMAVPVDVHPMGCPNPLNVGAKGLLPVAILGTTELNV